MRHYLELETPQSASNTTFKDYAVNDKNFDNQVYTNCVFEDVHFIGCLFKNVQFNDCEFRNVLFDNCKSSSMVFNKSIFYSSVIRKSKFNLTSITGCEFTRFRFYNSIFLGTNFEHCNMSSTILENSSFVKSSMINVILVQVLMFSNDFRNSSFSELYFESEVEIQKSNFSNCKFDESHFGVSRIMTTTFDDSHFFSVSYTNNSNIINCSFENVSYENTNIIATSVPIINEWPPVVLNISESVVSEQPSIIQRETDMMYIPERYRERTMPRSTVTRFRRTESEESLDGESLEGIQRQTAYDTASELLTLLRQTDPDRASDLLTQLRQIGPDRANDLLTQLRPTDTRANDLLTQLRQIDTDASIRENEVRQEGSKNKIIGITDRDVPVGQTAYEVIDGEVSLMEHLKENRDTIAFIFQQDYYISTRENITRMISDTTYSEKENNSVVYECFRTDTLRPENIVVENPLVKIASLGVAINGAYIQSSQLSMILSDKRYDIKYRIYEIIDTGKVLKSVVSYQVLNNMTSYVGASHCQAGQGGRVYQLRKIRNVDSMLSNLVKQYKYKTSKKRTTSGGKTKRLCKRKQRKTMKKKKIVKRKTIRRRK